MDATYDGYSFDAKSGVSDAGIYTVPLLSQGAAANLQLVVCQIAATGTFRFRIEPTNADDVSFRYDVAKDARVFDQTVLSTVAPITASVDGDVVTLKGINDVSVAIDSSKVVISVSVAGKEIATINENSKLFYEIGRKKVDAENSDGINDPIPNGASACGIDVSYKAKVYLTGFGERNEGMMLNDNNLYRSYNLDSYSRYGTATLIVGHAAGYSAGFYWSNPSDTWIKASSGDNQRNVRFVSEGGFIDLFVFAEAVSKITPSFQVLTGAPHMPPAWGFGYHQCKYGYNSQATVMDVLRGFEQSEIPFDVLWLDIDHLQNHAPFEWEHNNWPNPPEIVDTLTKANRKLVRICDCHLPARGDHVQGQECVNKGYSLRNADGSNYIGSCWPGDSVWPDFLDEDVAAWYASKYYYNEGRDYSTPIQHAWNDMNEASIFSNAQENTFPKVVKHNSGYELRETHNLYGMLQTSATHRGLIERNEDKNDRAFVLTRAWYPGVQKYAWYWSGDNDPNWDQLRNSVPMTLIGQLAGITCGQDIGGFNGVPSEELYVRWAQTAAIAYPFFRIHCREDQPRREPFLFQGDTRRRLEEAINCRYSLIAVWYTAGVQQLKTGRPPITPLWYDYPDVDALQTVENELILADTFLSAPVLDQNDHRQITFPPGRWRPFTRTATAWLTGQVSYQVTLDSIPLFLKEGKIAPVYDTIGSQTSTTIGGPLTLVIGPDADGKASGSLYLDDGSSFNFEKGEFLCLSFTYEAGTLTSTKAEKETQVPPLLANAKVTKIVVYGENEATTYDNLALALSEEWTWKA